MLPIVIDPQSVAVGLSGAGEGLERRRALLRDAGITPAAVAADAAPSSTDAALRGLDILFIAGLPPADAEALAARARLKGLLVNVEDRPELCDFQVPAVVRRGDLLVSVSTGGKAPGLAKLLREWLGRRLNAEWGEHTAEIARARAVWRGAGHTPADVARLTREHVAGRGWLG